MVRFTHSKYRQDQGGSYPSLPKKKPAYFDPLQPFPETTLIFIAVDKVSLSVMQRFHQNCLFCQEDAAVYDLDFCYQREVWVLYADNLHFISALQLAHTVQRSGAAKVCAILVDHSWVQEKVDA